MPKTGLTSEEIKEKALQITEEKIRYYGFDKFRLTDIAKELKVSHAALYNHFPDKAALLDAISERWLARMDNTLELITQQERSPRRLIIEWFLKYHELKKEKVLKDPELYKSFNMAAELLKPFIVQHLHNVNEQLVALVQKAIAAGEIRGEPENVAVLLLEATTSFHHPRMVLDHKDEQREMLLQKVVEVLLDGFQ
ncbi:transcriptional regulator, TetR family [Paenibacillus sophorae]|uniref:TetR/AcrR family transcriptional regulator n=1 Tax=Paenibacillus sophorae TaxID=1333845 RepID=A0A1H8MPP6_9BACL|nr:TetR/AcrR family transcriptional regulator [Paenibacillus sophorae]QWU17894.1 TetR/AcrR family transcriptional regulator [Paenibacillus sophorae]SEO19204.1 transcriptional regulator, TetR family [Paenibacillus sophorae]